MGFIASRICRNEDDSFQQYGTLFIFIPLLAGACGTFNGNYVGGSIACGLASLALTTLIGNLSLKNCLLLAISVPLILCFATWPGNATETLLSEHSQSTHWSETGRRKSKIQNRWLSQLRRCAGQ